MSETALSSPKLPATAARIPRVNQETAPSKRPATMPAPTSLKLSPQAIYRRYEPVFPTTNRGLAYKWDMTARQKHLDSLANAKTCLSTNSPAVVVGRKRSITFKLAPAPGKPIPIKSLVGRRSKKDQMAQEEGERIERDNLILLQRMAHQSAHAGGVSNMDNRLNIKPVKRAVHDTHKREEDLETIKRDNMAFVQRLESREANYKTSEWKEQYKTNIKYLINISRYPELYDTDVLPVLGREVTTAWVGSAEIRSQTAAPRGNRLLPNLPKPQVARGSKKTETDEEGKVIRVTKAAEQEKRMDAPTALFVGHLKAASIPSLASSVFKLASKAASRTMSRSISKMMGSKELLENPSIIAPAAVDTAAPAQTEQGQEAEVEDPAASQSEPAETIAPVSEPLAA